MASDEIRRIKTKRWGSAMIRAAADIAKQKGVEVRLEPDGAIVVTPALPEPASTESPLEKWKRERAPDPPILPSPDHREKTVMEFLMVQGVGSSVHVSTIKFAGPRTLDRLFDRGFIERLHQAGSPRSEERIALLAKGMQAMKAQVLHYRRHPSL